MFKINTIFSLNTNSNFNQFHREVESFPEMCKFPQVFHSQRKYVTVKVKSIK